LGCSRRLAAGWVINDSCALSAVFIFLSLLLSSLCSHAGAHQRQTFHSFSSTRGETSERVYKRERMLRNKGLGGPHVHPNDTHPTPAIRPDPAAQQQKQQPLHQITLSRRQSFSPTAPIARSHSTRQHMRNFLDKEF
jgi:hypothetical protein